MFLRTIPCNGQGHSLTSILSSRGVKMRTLLISLVFFVTALLVSCSSSEEADNNRINSGTLSAIRKGMTTKEQVRAILGAPQGTKTQVPVRQPAGITSLPAKYIAAEIWGYSTASNERPLFHLPFSASDSAKQASCTVIIFFDEHGTVLDYETSGQLPDKGPAGNM